MRTLAIACLGVALCGCDNAGTATDGGADQAAPAPDLIAADLTAVAPTASASIRAVPDCVVMAVVDVDVTNADHVEVAFGATTAYGSKTPRIAVPPGAGKVSVPLFGLAPAATTHARATAFNGTLSADSNDVMVTTGALPSDVPPLKITTNVNMPEDYILITAFKDFQSTAWALAYERKSGRLAFYRDITPATTRAFDFQQQPNGHFSIFQNKTNRFEEMLSTSEVVNHWSLPQVAKGADGHDIKFLPNNNALLIGLAEHTDNTYGLFDGGAADSTVIHNTIDEVTPDGGTVFHWETYPEIQLSDAVEYGILLEGELDSVHINAVEPAPDGNFIVSMRQLDCVAKVDRVSKKIAWRLGGKKNDYTFMNDPYYGTSHQHDSRFLPNGHLMIYDNGNFRAPEETRVVEYELDEAKKTATLVWSYQHNPPVFSLLAGSARRLANGNTVVSYAIQGMVTEVDAAKNVKWEANVAPYQLYRGLPVSSLYAP